MNISLKNTGKTGETSVELNGITVIAGENNTGKSMIGKALYAVLDTLNGKDIEIEMNCNGTDHLTRWATTNKNIIYIDNPFIIDELSNCEYSINPNLKSHKKNLLKFLAQRQDEPATAKVMQIISVVNQVCDGSLVKTGDGYSYSSPKLQKPMVLSGISTDLKTFLILKTLLTNGAVEEGGILILDNPEAHLHPNWQLVLAELVVLFQKELSVYILANTYSPYFLRAIEVYSARYGIEERCKYYLSEARDEQFCISDVTDSIDKIYETFYLPLEIL